MTASIRRGNCSRPATGTSIRVVLRVVLGPPTGPFSVPFAISVGLAFSVTLAIPVGLGFGPLTLTGGACVVFLGPGLVASVFFAGPVAGLVSSGSLLWLVSTIA